MTSPFRVLFRSAFACLALFTFFVCTVEDTARASEPVRVLSFNIRMSHADDGENSWPLRREFLMDVVRGIEEGDVSRKTHLYDFIGMQEAVLDPREERNQVGYVGKAMPEYGTIYLSREKTPDRGETMLLLYLKERWELDPEDTGTFWLSDTPEVPGVITWKDAGCPRIVTYGLFHELVDGKRSGKKVYVYNTHLDHMSETARQKGAVVALDRIAAGKDKSVPAILMGDFNCGERSPAIRYLQGESMAIDGTEKVPALAMVDTFRAVHPDATDVGSFTGFKKPGKEKIDYIFVSGGLETLETKIIRTMRDGKYPSDHFPVEAVLQFP